MEHLLVGSSDASEHRPSHGIARADRWRLASNFLSNLLNSQLH